MGVNKFPGVQLAGATQRHSHPPPQKTSDGEDIRLGIGLDIRTVAHVALLHAMQLVFGIPQT